MHVNTEGVTSLERFLDSTRDGVFLLDRERRFVLFNAAAERITGFPRAELLGRACRCFDAMQCRDPQGRALSGVLCPQRQLAASAELDGLRQRMSIVRPDGSQVWVESSYSRLRDSENGELTLCIMRDISDARHHERELIASLNEWRAQAERLRAELAGRYGFGTLLAGSAAMLPVLERVRAAIACDAPVLVRGPVGSGKEFVARTIHDHGTRRAGPFVVAAPTGLSTERLEAELFGGADGAGLWAKAASGTLLVDEWADLAAPVQIRLLRQVQSAASGPRLIFTSRHDPAALVASGRLRRDLFDFAAVIRIETPALAGRRDDIPLLVQQQIDALNATGPRRVSEVSPRAWTLLLNHAWPGNVRELCAAVHAAFATGSGPILQASELPESVRAASTAGAAGESPKLLLDPLLERIERETILAALRQAGGQRNLAAKLMGISRSRLYRRMDDLGISQADRDGDGPR